MHIVCWITKAKNTHSESVILIAFPLQQSLRERTSLLHSTYSPLPVLFDCNLCWLFVISGFRHAYCHTAKVIYWWTMEHRKQPVPQEIALASDIFDKFCSSPTLKAILGHHRQLCELLHIKPTFFPHFYPKLKVRFLVIALLFPCQETGPVRSVSFSCGLELQARKWTVTSNFVL